MRKVLRLVDEPVALRLDRLVYVSTLTKVVLVGISQGLMNVNRTKAVPVTQKKYDQYKM